MAEQRQKRSDQLLKNGFFSVISWAAPFSLGFIVTPVIVRGLGNEAFGIYMMVLAFINYSFSFGIGKAAAKYVAEYRAAGETDKISETVSVVIWLSVGFGLLSILTVSLFSHYIVSNVLLIPDEFAQTAQMALLIASISILATMLSQVFQFVLQGLHRFDLFLLFTNVGGLLLNLGNLLLVYSGSGLVPLIAWNCVMIMVQGSIFYLTARRLLPEFELKVRISLSSWLRAFRYAVSIIVYQICGNVMLIFERAWILRRFGPEALTYYVVPMLVGFYFHALVSNLCIVLFPVVNELLLDGPKLARLYRTSTKIIASLVALFLLSSIVSGNMFLTVWVRADFPERSYDVLVFHVLTFSVISITTVAWQLTESFGQAKVNALCAFAWMVISVPLMIFFAETWQISGVAAARMIGVAAMLPLIVFVESRLLKGLLSGFWLSLICRLVPAAILAGASEYVVVHYLPNSWGTLLLSGLVGTFVLYFFLLILGALDQEEKGVLKSLFRRFQRAAT